MEIPKTGSSGFFGLLRSRYFIGTVVTIVLVLLVVSMFNHTLNGDEAWIGEHGYFKAKDDYVHSNFFKGFFYQDQRIIIYHYLFVTVESLIFRIAGFGLEQSRIVPMLFGGLLLLLLWYFCRKELRLSIEQSLLGLLLFLLIPQAFYFMKIARPEMMLTFLGFSSALLLYKDNLSPGWGYVVLGAITAGAAMLTHLNGSIFVGTGALVLLGQRKYLKTIAFCSIALLTISPLLYEVTSHFDQFTRQFNNPYITAKTEVKKGFAPLINLTKEHQRLFRKPEIILAMVLFLISIIFSWKRTRLSFLRNYCIMLMIVFGIIVEDKTIKYSTYLAPFWAVLIADALWMLSAEIRKYWKILFAVSAASFLLFGLYYQFNDAQQKEEYVSLNERIGKHLPDHSWCIAPMNFMYNQVERLNIISNVLVRFETHDRPFSDSLAAMCDRKDAPYLIFNKYGDPIDNLTDLPTNRSHVLSLFDVVAEEPDYIIFKRKR